MAVGQGDGWGGPAKGAGRGGPAKPFTKDFQPPSKAPDGDKKALRRIRTEQLEDMLFSLAEAAQREETRISAAVRLHAIYNGQPVARNINVNTDDVANLSDDELRAELERAGGAAPEAAKGASAKGNKG